MDEYTRDAEAGLEREAVAIPIRVVDDARLRAWKRSTGSNALPLTRHHQYAVKSSA